MATYWDEEYKQQECKVKERNGGLVLIEDENGKEKYVYDFNVDEQR